MNKENLNEKIKDAALDAVSEFICDEEIDDCFSYKVTLEIGVDDGWCRVDVVE